MTLRGQALALLLSGEMAAKTRGDLLARTALVPRTLEARGLDASPPMKARLLAAGDTAAAGGFHGRGDRPAGAA